MIYVASSWRNPYYPAVLAALKEEGLPFYDFRNPDCVFHWSDIDPNWKRWTADQYVDALNHDLAGPPFASDMGALRESKQLVLLLPSGRSAHAEAGWAAGAGKPVHVFSPLDELIEPELMYKMFNGIYSDIDILMSALRLSGEV